MDLDASLRTLTDGDAAEQLVRVAPVQGVPAFVRGDGVFVALVAVADGEGLTEMVFNHFALGVVAASVRGAHLRTRERKEQRGDEEKFRGNFEETSRTFRLSEEVGRRSVISVEALAGSRSYLQLTSVRCFGIHSTIVSETLVEEEGMRNRENQPSAFNWSWDLDQRTTRGSGFKACAGREGSLTGIDDARSRAGVGAQFLVVEDAVDAAVRVVEVLLCSRRGATPAAALAAANRAARRAVIILAHDADDVVGAHRSLYRPSGEGARAFSSAFRVPSSNESGHTKPPLLRLAEYYEYDQYRFKTPKPSPFQGDGNANYSARSSPARQSVTNVDTNYLTLHHDKVRSTILCPSSNRFLSDAIHGIAHPTYGSEFFTELNYLLLIATGWTTGWVTYL